MPRYRRYRRGKKGKEKDYSKYTAKQLRSVIRRRKKEIDEYESNLPVLTKQCEPEKAKAEFNSKISDKITAVQARIYETERKDRESKSFWKKLFESEPQSVSPEAASAIKKLKADIDKLHAQILKTKYVWLSSEISLLEAKALVAKLNLQEAEAAMPAALEVEQKQKAEKKTKEDKRKKKYQEKAAIAAAHLGKTRKLASRVKKMLPEHDTCPYCQGPIGEDLHADHIYPVSRGGLSVEENMVNICNDCNAKKTNMTLREFIKKYKLDRESIEKRLEKLGKKF